MSTVYRGVDTRLDRPVAIKIMDARFAGDPAFRIRFEREARSAARIDHPAVVDVHDQGADQRPAVPRHGAGRRRHAARRAARPGRPRRARGVRRHGAGALRARRGAPARDGAPRRQAGERADLRGPAGEGRRLRARGRGGAGGRQPRGHDHGHGRVPVPRAGRHRRGRPPQRRLRGGHPALRAAHRRAAVHRRHGDLGGLPARHLRRPGPVGGRGRRAARAGRVRAARHPARPGGPPGRRRRDAGRAAHARRGAGGAAGARARAAAEAGGGADHAAPRAPAAGARRHPPARTRRPPVDPARPACGRGAPAVGCSRVWITLVLVLALVIGAHRVVARQRALDGRAVAHRGAAGRRRAPAHGRRPGARHAARLRRGRAARASSRTRSRARRPRCCGAAPSPSWCRRGSRPCPPSPRAPPSTTRRTRSAPPSSRPCSRARSTARRCREGAVVRTIPGAGTPLPAGQPRRRSW